MGDAALTNGKRGSTPKTVDIINQRDLIGYIKPFLEKRSHFLRTAERGGTPCFLFDKESLIKRANQFKGAFENRFPAIKFFYAMKSNNYPALSQSLLDLGFGLDVSSGEELRQAVDLEASNIIFSGPGKTDEELEMALRQTRQVIVLIDSFGELERLGRISRHSENRIRVGVRLTTEENGLWRKFGISLDELGRFIEIASKHEYIDFRGVQFHTSWNLTPENQIQFLTRMGKTIAKLDDKYRHLIRFVDMGGGYWPQRGEWIHSTSLPEEERPASCPVEAHCCRPAKTIEDFARRLAAAVREHLASLPPHTIFVEPGRWICNDAMHIVVKVVDKKAPDLVITDGATNMIGWERFETDYFPVINLDRPAEEEKRCMILGSLCTPHDVWGYSYFGTGIEPGDTLLIPFQGAYTYSLRQRFIKALPRVVALETTDAAE